VTVVLLLDVETTPPLLEEAPKWKDPEAADDTATEEEFETTAPLVVVPLNKKDGPVDV